MARTLFVLLTLALVSCFEPPIDERVEVEFLADGAIDVTVRVTVGEEAAEGGNEALRRRVQELRQALLEGWDDWTQRFERLEPLRETLRWEKREGELVLHERKVRLRDADQLTRFFAEAGVSAFYSEADGWAELAIYPGTSTRASRRQRNQVDNALEEWVDVVGRYLDRASDLYAYLDRAPERATPVLGSLFDEMIDESVRAGLEPPDEVERQLLDELGAAMEKVWGVLLVESGQAYSLNELSQRVYDPFPARILVKVPSSVERVEGFGVENGETLVIGPIGLWEALSALESRWVYPDLLPIYVRHARSSEPVDLEQLAGERRRAESSVRRSEVRGEIEQRLAPAEVYRASWPTGR